MNEMMETLLRMTVAVLTANLKLQASLVLLSHSLLFAPKFVEMVLTMVTMSAMTAIQLTETDVLLHAQ